MTQPSTFSGTVFTDGNDNGLVDGTDTGLGGVTVQLLDGAGNPTGLTTTTAANGSYSFTNLAPGTYSAHVVLPTTPAGATFSPYGSTTPPQPTGGAVSAEQNLLTNGSFETSGANTTALGYAGWTSSTNTAATPFGSGPGDGPEIALTNSSTAYAIDPLGHTNPYAGVVAPDSADPNYLGGSGTHAAFFVDDGAIETLSQTVNLTAGQTYEVGFDLLETTPGQNNAGYFSLSAAIGGQTITTAGSLSGTKLTPGVWTHFADLFTPTTTGAVTLTFSYASGVPGSTLASKDVLVDDVYVVPGQVTTNLTTTSEVNTQGNTAPVTLGAGQSVGNESAGIYYPPATISGTVFTDAIADGVKGSGDTGLSGRTVNLTTGGVITATTVTDSAGNYSFTNQAAGTYTVTVQAPSGDKFSPAGGSTTQTDSTVGSGGTQTVTVASGGTAIVNAGVYAPVTVKGVVFTDTNGDGVQQAGDGGLGSVSVKLVNASGVAVATTTTGATGAYSFTGQTPGSYTVQVVTPTGDGVSPNGTSTTLTDSTVGAGGSQAVIVTSGGSATVNAGLFAPSTIGGTVFADANADGAQQAGDAGLGGQTVELLGANGQIIATTTTAANGQYSFTGVAPGNDSILVVPPAGDRFSPAGSSTTLTDSTVSAVGSSPVVVASGTASVVNAGVYAPVSVSGTVFTDANADGVQQPGDAGVAGQGVTLTGANGVSLGTVTGANGGYSFTGLTPGSYTVNTGIPAGDSASPAGGSTSLPDSSVSASGAATVTLASGAAATVNAGEYAPSTIQGVVFSDTNADGVQAAGEAGVAGRTVNLLGPDGHVLATTATAADGSYSFAGVQPGMDKVAVVAPAGSAFSPVGSSTSLPDSTVSQTGTASVTVTSGSSSTVDAGLYQPASVVGTVFADANGDGTREAGDTGVGGEPVALIANGVVVANTTTDASGNYAFTGLQPGQYTVHVGLPAGDSFSPTGTSATLPNSQVSATGGHLVTVGSGVTATVDAGIVAPASITGTIFSDTNGNGVQDIGDAGLGGQTVELLGSNGQIIATTTTAANGGYSFTGVAPGADTVAVVAPAGSAFSPVGSSTSLPDSTVSQTGTASVTVTSGSSSAVDAGLYQPASVVGTVFADANGDGTREAGETGVGGEPVALIANGVVVANTTTDASGNYAFTGLQPGQYTVHVGLPAGDSFSPTGTSATLPNSQVSATGGHLVTVGSGVTATVDAGIVAPASITGTIFSDANGNGVQDAGDAGLGGQTIELLGSNGQIIATTTTAANGGYSFAGVAPGADTIQVVAAAGETFSPGSVGPNGVAAVAVTAGSATILNAGEYAPAAIEGTVFADANGDGTIEAGDTGIAGEPVALTVNGVVVANATTDASGNYAFTGLQPGQYKVHVGLPAGDSFSPAGTSATQPNSQVSATGGHLVTVGSGVTATVDAGIVAPASITGTIFSDANGNGLQDTGDAGLGGQTVELLGGNGQIIATTTTAANGGYSFAGVAPGADTIQVVAAAGETFSPGSVGPNGVAAITVIAGSATVLNAGEYAPAAIEGIVFSDANADGAQQAGEPGIAGQTVALIGPDGHSVATTATDASGHYDFAGVVPGQYSVQVSPPAGTLFSPGSAATQMVSVSAGADAIVNAAEYTLTTIAGTVFADSNGDGVKETGETGIAGVTVNLEQGTTVVATTTTDANGGYSFQNVIPGTDTVSVVAPASEAFSPIGTNAALPDSTVASDGSQTLAIGAGTAAQVNAGLFVPATIDGHAFLDAHFDGLDDFGNPAFSGVGVKLYDGAGNFTGVSTTTDSDGRYSFADLVPGSYQVQFMAPAGTAFAQEHAGSNRAIDSDANAAGRTETFTLTAGQTDVTRNAGLTLTGGYANTGVVTGSGNLNGGGDSIIVGGAGVNTIEGGSGTNLIVGGSGPYAQIQGLGGTDIIYGGQGDDLIQGHAGNAFIAAGIGNQTLVGGGGTNVFIANANGGTITDSNGVFSGISGGDVFVTHGNTASVYQAGDGVLTIDDYDASAGDTLQVYGYSAPTAVGQANGYQVLYFGADSAILVRANNTTVSADGVIQGVSFAQAAPATPLSTVAVTAANYLTLTEAGAATPLIGPGTAPTITGAVAGQAVADNASITPFSGLVIADPHAGQTETVTVTPFAQDGSFSRTGGGSVTNGVYTVTGTAQTVTAALDALMFNPSFHQVAVGQTVTTGFEITVIDAAGYSRSDATTSVIATATDLAPTIAGAVASQAATAGSAVHPFAGVVIGDPDGGMTETVTVTLSNPAGGTLSNLGNGHYDTTAGTYTTVGTAAATTANLDQVVFTPAQAGSTGFAIGVTDNAGGTAAASVTAAVSVTASATATVAVAAPMPASFATPAPVSASDADQTVVRTGWNNVVAVGNGANTIDGGNGNATITAGDGHNVIKVAGYSSVVTVGAGVDSIDAGSNVTITAAGGSQSITLSGYGNMVFIGGSAPGNSVITGGLGNSQITTTAGSASITLAGYGNTVTTGGANDTIADGAGGTQFLVGPTQTGLSGGAEIITNFQTSGLVDILRGAGGLQSAGDALNALTAVNGGTRLNLGSGGSVTFLGLSPTDLHASNFKID